jgi:DNA topoisomerase-1
MPGILREKSGDGFRYRYPTGDLVTDDEVLKRIKAMAIPPAWTEVWICPDPCGHLQATGRDARGRKQNRYHAKWREVRDENKFARMIAFAKALPKIRAAVQRDLQRPPLTRDNVLATVVRLLELSLIRVGNEEYARNNDSFGLTTLRDRHVRVRGSNLIFSFRGKGGKWHEVGVQDRRLARLVKNCQDIPGQELFQYLDVDGMRRKVSSEDVNAYLREISGQEFTAKDFRTWAGTVLAAAELAGQGVCETKKQARKSLVAAVQAVAARLGNTPAVCKKCYIHPHVLGAFSETRLVNLLQVTPGSKRNGQGLRLEERAVLRFLKKRLALERKQQADPSEPFAATFAALRKS